MNAEEEDDIESLEAEELLEQQRIRDEHAQIRSRLDRVAVVLPVFLRAVFFALCVLFICVSEFVRATVHKHMRSK